MSFFLVFKQAYRYINQRCEVDIPTRDDFFSIFHFKARSKGHDLSIPELLYAENVAICASSNEQLWELLSSLAEACNNSGLTISLMKTAVRSQSAPYATFQVN